MNRVEASTALLSDVDDPALVIHADFPGQIGLQLEVYHTAMNDRDVLGASPGLRPANGDR